MEFGKSGFAAEKLNQKDVGNRARHADDELAEAIGTALAQMRREETKVGKDVIGIVSGLFVTCQKWPWVREFRDEEFAAFFCALRVEVFAIAVVHQRGIVQRAVGQGAKPDRHSDVFGEGGVCNDPVHALDKYGAGQGIGRRCVANKR